MIHTAIVCGGREGLVPAGLTAKDATRDQLAQWTALGRMALTNFRHERAPELRHVVVGSARGCDWLAFGWAIDHELDATVASAKWKSQKRAAGPIRNRRMLDVYLPQVVLALPGGRGTWDMQEATRERIALSDQQGIFGWDEAGALTKRAPGPQACQLWQCEIDFDALGFKWKREA